MSGLIAPALCPGISRPTIADLRVNRIRNGKGGGVFECGVDDLFSAQLFSFLGTFSGR